MVSGLALGVVHLPRGMLINELTRVTLNGSDQWVLMRGVSPRNPILLVLHGGPGFAQISFAPAFQAELEQRFIVTNWDQRGAGKSYVRGLSAASLTLQTYVDDTAALLRWLIGRFGQSRVLLVGHSWGSTVGMQVARHLSDLLHGFVATGFGVQFHSPPFEEPERFAEVLAALDPALKRRNAPLRTSLRRGAGVLTFKTAQW